MVRLKKTKKYYFSVEGETEKWYLEWLLKTINESTECKYKVAFDCKVEKNPLKRVKSMTVTSKIVVYHISDYESDDEIHVKEFKDTMDNMKNAQRIGKQITYLFGYTNLTFDLWIILHKSSFNAPITNRKQYINPINKFYNEKFENMDDYKHEKNFKRILEKLKLSDVKSAIERAKNIMEKNKDHGYVLQQYKGYRYYKENPSLGIWEIFEQILKDCDLV